MEGRLFSAKVWKALTKVGHGKIASYGQIAKKRFAPSKPVEQLAERTMPTAYLYSHPLPQNHWKQRKMVGYAGGLNKKRWLLEHEGVLSTNELITQVLHKILPITEKKSSNWEFYEIKFLVFCLF